MLFLTSSVSGCGSGQSHRCVVKGTATYDGKPIVNGRIQFVPETGPIVEADIILGEYLISDRGGLPTGKYTIFITAHTIDFRDARLDDREIPEIGYAKEFQYIPEKYNRNSKLVEVISGDRNPLTLDFVLEKD